MTKITPRNLFVLVKPDEEQSRKSENGILTPKNVEKEKKAFGTVISIGEEVKGIKIGDRVIYMMFSGEKLELKEEEFILLHDDEIIAFLEEE
ncbi:co-chaperone GroES [bacterium]|nr:MAG: co-chaperone GroES [bacterium]